MASAQPGATYLRDIERIFHEGTVAGQKDEQLLRRFADAGDELAFRALVARYGPMVLTVCRGVLRDKIDAEDAFQATFLVLVRRARSIQDESALGAWLHRVAVRVAVEANRASARRRGAERRAAEEKTMNLRPELGRDGCPSPLHEELDRLPGRYRLPIVLYYLQGQTHEQVAAQLSLSVGTLRRRLDRGRELLRARLSRRGVGWAGCTTALLVGRSAEATVPQSLVDATIRAATGVAASRAVAAGACSATAAALTEGVLRAMFLTRLKLAAAAVAIVATAGAAAAVVVAGSGGADEPPQMKKDSTAVRPTPREAPRIAPAGAGESIRFRGQVLGPDNQPVVGAKLSLGDLKRERAGEPTVWSTTDASGRFDFSVAKTQYEGPEPDVMWRSVPIVASAEGYGPDWRDSSTVKPGAGVTLRLVKDDVPIEGRVLDLEGRPVVGAKVTVAGLSAPAGNDLEPYLKLVREDPVEASNYNFEKGLGAVAQIPGQVGSVTTGADGRFRIGGLGRDRVVSLDIEGPDIQSARVTVMTRASGPVVTEPGKNHTVRILGARSDHLIPPGRTVTGVIRDKVTGKPIADVSVGGQGTNSRATTGPDGQFSISGFPKGKQYGLLALPRDGAPYFVTCVNLPDTAGLGPIETAIECVPGIPYRLKLVDKQTGEPIRAAEVRYHPIYPNPRTREVPGYEPINARGPYSMARRDPDGTYTSAVLPGPGALCVRVRDAKKYMPTCVDPKAFFGDPIATSVEGTRFGDRRSLAVATGAQGGTMMRQDQFAAIILVNPPADSKPLALEFAIERDPELKVAVVGPDGVPMSGVKTVVVGPDGVPMSGANAGGAGATDDPRIFSVSRLNPMRPKRVLFTQPEKRLAGFLMARGDEPAPPKIKLEPWGAITGRLVDRAGKPRAQVSFQTRDPEANAFNPAYGTLPGGGSTTDGAGRFRVEGLVPGQKYSAIVPAQDPADESGTVFDEIVLFPGETKDLGDVRAGLPGKEVTR